MSEKPDRKEKINVQMKELMRRPPDDLRALAFQMAVRGNMKAVRGINLILDYANKRVRVYKGRKVPVGTEGVCFWLGCRSYGKYDDPWGLSASFRCGIRDDDGNVFWTSADNIELANRAM